MAPEQTTTPRTRVEPLVVRYLGANIVLECACGLRITQPVRAAIATIAIRRTVSWAKLRGTIGAGKPG